VPEITDRNFHEIAASELHRSPQYQEDERATAILDNAPAEIHSCVWEGAFGHTWTIGEARGRIAEWQRSRDDYLRNGAIREQNQAIREQNQATINGLPVLA
jgi:hypothetical protein